MAQLGLRAAGAKRHWGCLAGTQGGQHSRVTGAIPGRHSRVAGAAWHCGHMWPGRNSGWQGSSGARTTHHPVGMHGDWGQHSGAAQHAGSIGAMCGPSGAPGRSGPCTAWATQRWSCLAGPQLWGSWGHTQLVLRGHLALRLPDAWLGLGVPRATQHWGLPLSGRDLRWLALQGGWSHSQLVLWACPALGPSAAQLGLGAAWATQFWGRPPVGTRGG